MTVTVVLESLPAIAGDGLSTSTDYRLQRVYIFATRQGLLYVALLLVMLLGAINYTNSMAYVLTFLLGSLFLVCMLHTYRNMRSLLISTPSARPVFAGEDIQLPLLFDNRSGLKRIGIEVVLEQPGSRKQRRLAPQSEPLQINLGAHQVRQGYLCIHTRRRGTLRPGDLRIQSRFPLGLLRTWSYIESDQECLVYPAPRGTTVLPGHASYQADEQLGHSAGTDDFTGFRPYQYGDSIRNIDWKSFAREVPLQVKRFGGGGAGKLRLLWEHCAHLGDDEARLSQLCLWVTEAERLGLLYALEIPGTSLDMDAGEHHMHACLAALARYGNSDT